MSESHERTDAAAAEEVVLPVKRTDGETIEERLTENAYHNILPARYLRKDAEGNLIENQEELFERVAKNIALAEAVYEAGRRDVEVRVRPAQLKPDHPRRDELAAEVFGHGVGVDDDVETPLTERNVNKFAYDTVVPALPDEVRAHVESLKGEFQELMERLSFIPNSPTLMNAGDELQQLSACFVMSPDDDLSDIHETAKKAAEVFQCLTDDTLVPVEGEGLLPIDEVEVGDRVLQRNGDGHRYQRVIETHSYDDAPVKRIETSCGLAVTGTPNHRLWCEGAWREIDEIRPGDTLAIRLDWLPHDERRPDLQSVEVGPRWEDSRKVSNEAIASLHAEGLSDCEIAAQLDVSSSTIQRRRSDELGLHPNGSGGRSKGIGVDRRRLLALYDAGRSDREMAESLGVSVGTIRRYRTRHGLQSKRMGVKRVTQPASLSPDLAELLGLWIGDGSVHADGIRFHINREETLERADRLARRAFDAGIDWTWKDGCYEAVIHSHEVKRWWLANFGDAKPSSPEAEVPEVIQRADRACVGAFLRGLFTADGSLQKGTYPRLWSASERLVEQVQQLLLGLGIPASRWEIDDDRDYFSVHVVTGRGLDAFVELVGFIDDREEEMRASVERTAFRRTGEDEVDGSTWYHPVEAVVDDGTDTVYDLTLEDEHEYVANGIVSHNSGGGVGYAFWQLRPYGDPVGSTGGIASGPLTFMETFDQLCETIAQGGTRRGAQMGVMRVSHPDVIEFIHAKNKDVSLAHSLRLNDPDDYTYTTFSEALEEARELIDDEGRVPKHLRNAVEGHLSNFNISVGITDDFMAALADDGAFTFTNPRTGEPHVATAETKEMYERYDLGDHVEVGEVLSMPAAVIWDRIVEGAHENGEPGVIFLERVNKEHSFDVKEHPEHLILATNPCGEQPLEEFEACNLGHINLSTLAAVDRPDWRIWYEDHGDDHDDLAGAVEAFLEEAIDWEEFDHRIEYATRFLENVVTMSDFPVEEIEETVRRMRKIGLGIMGLAQLYIQLGVRYGSDPANEIARQVMMHINHGSKWASHELALERGSFAEWDHSKYADPVRYREWFEHQTGLDADEWADGFPVRNHNTTTIAPTGTTGMVGNTTGGCEPIYNVAYYKNVSDDVQGDEMLVEFDDYFLRVLEANDIDVNAVKAEAQEQMANNAFDGVEGLETVPDAIGELFVVTADLTGKEHAAVQCACQAGVDSAISKTVNFPNEASIADMREVFEFIYEHGGKGVTVYRDGTRSKQVLTTRADNADFADEDEAAEALLEQIVEAFGGLDDFLGHDEVRTMLQDELEDDGEGAPTALLAGEYARKRPRPDVLYGVTQRIDTGYGKLYVNINEDEHGRPFELFANIGNSGGFTASFTEALAKTISTALRSGVAPEEIADELRGIRSPKVAWDKGQQINSIPDAIGIAMRRYLDGEVNRSYPQQANLDEIGAEVDVDTGVDAVTGPGPGPDPDPERETDGGAAAGPGPGTSDDDQALIDAGESPECPSCGSLSLHYTEGCKTCQSCGWSEC